jgi:hypothetical protein
MKKTRHLFNFCFFITGLLFYTSSYGVLSTPSITSPTNNATKILNKYTVTTSSTGGTYFVFDLDSTTGFNTGYRKRFAKSTSSSKILDSLPFNQTHYIRVKIFNATNTDSSAWSATIKFTTYNTIAALNKTPSYALLAFSWTGNTVTKLEIQIDTTKLFNTSYFQSYISTSPAIGSWNFKYTKTNQNYFIRYRSRYGSKTSSWIDGGTIYSNKGYQIIYSTLTDGFILQKNIRYSSNYNGDNNVTYSIEIDTVITFNSSSLFKKTTTATNFDFVAKPSRNYFMRITMTYPNGIWTGDSIYKFSTAKVSPSYNSLNSGAFQFFIPPGFTGGAIEMDTTISFNSPLKTHFDTSFAVSILQQSFVKSYSNIKKYHNLYLRYKVISPDYELDWYCNNKHFFVPYYNVSATGNAPTTPFTYSMYYNDMTGKVYEADTSLKFNSKIKVRGYISKSKMDSIRNLKFGLKYYLRVKQFNANKDTTEWGAALPLKTFDTVRIAYPYQTTLYYPNFGFNADRWPGIKLFHWQLDTVNSFKNPSNFYTLNTPIDNSSFPINKRYYWRMRIISAVDTSKWSRTGWFDYKINYLLPLPFLIYPPNNAQNVPTQNVTFLWKDNTGGLGTDYEFVLTKTGENNNMASLKNSSILIKNLKPNSSYTWYVRSFTKNFTTPDITSKYIFSFTTAGFSTVNTIENNAGISVYPNPAESEILVNFVNGNPIYEVTIYSLDGRMIDKKINLNSSEVELDIRGLSNGMYIIACESDKGISVSKFIKK